MSRREVSGRNEGLDDYILCFFLGGLVSTATMSVRLHRHSTADGRFNSALIPCRLYQRFSVVRITDKDGIYPARKK